MQVGAYGGFCLVAATMRHYKLRGLAALQGCCSDTEPCSSEPREQGRAIRCVCVRESRCLRCEFFCASDVLYVCVNARCEMVCVY